MLREESICTFFGGLTGLPGVLMCLAIAALWTYAAWLLYRLDLRGGWLIFIAICAFIASAIVTFARHDMLEMCRLIPEIIAAVQAFVLAAVPVEHATLPRWTITTTFM